MRTSDTATPARAADHDTIPAETLQSPAIRLAGTVDADMLASFFSQRDAAMKGDGLIVVHLTTEGGDADLGRRIGDEIRLCREHLGRDLAFLGISTVYSSGVTIMSAFPRARRYLTKGAALLIHGRKIEAEKIPAGFLPAALQFVQSKAAEFENGLRLQRDGFRQLVEDTGVSLEELEQRALTNWYVTAEEALKRRLVAGVV